VYARIKPVKKLIISAVTLAIAATGVFLGCGGAEEESPMKNEDPPAPGKPDLPPDGGE
tara:strand:+ start:305 stop:478 length:174 start_codon:yes stop_codon:yes gene_type:complete